MFYIDEKIYDIKDIDVLLDEDIKFVKNVHGIAFANIPCCIDIETSSFMENDEKRGIMYCWVLGINGKGIIGRTYDELNSLLEHISEFYGLSDKKRMIFYVHNLAYEFQWFRHRFAWEKVFAIEPRKIVYASAIIGIELRCSYLLSGYSLEKVGEHLTTYKVQKMVGDLDYSKIRHEKTPLYKRELKYVLHDALVVMAYIQEQIDQYKYITRIPLTKTGKVREYCRKRCMYNGGTHKKTWKNRQDKYYKFRKLMSYLTIASVPEYEQLKRGFQGGFTHANSFYVGKTIHDVTSFDFSSSYPAVMVSEQFPMSRGQLVNIKTKEDFEHYIHTYCCLFDATFIDIHSTQPQDHPISVSKCFNIMKNVTDNGRLVSAKQITTTITEQDYFTYREFYEWKSMRVKNFRIYKKGYLPHDLVISILDLYEKKTTLKGVKGAEIEYMNSKENVNSVYGMSVTDICRDELTYTGDDIVDDGGWKSSPCDYEKELEKYNKSKRRFLFYPWGIWVTAYARRNLFSGIKECGMDYVYSDTDSIKIRNANAYEQYIKNYNDKMIRKLKIAFSFQHIEFDKASPKTIEGKTKTIGLWEKDDHYLTFKTQGAKRYMVEHDDGELSFTISGVNKKHAIPYLIEYAKTNHTTIFDLFEDGMYIPPEYTGKNTHTYIDYETEGDVIDYLGVKCHYHEYSSIHMAPCEYEMSMAQEFIDYLLGIEEFID